MGLRVHGDSIESLIKERRETEKEVKLLQAEIDRARMERETVLKEEVPPVSESLAELDDRIEKLKAQKKERAVKLGDICRVVRTISAGD